MVACNFYCISSYYLSADRIGISGLSSERMVQRRFLFLPVPLMVIEPPFSTSTFLFYNPVLYLF